MSEAGPRGPALVLRRILPVPPANVFAAWTDPELLGRWMSPFGTASASLDLRVGGNFRIVMNGPDRSIEHTGTYQVIDPPHRLVFTWQSVYTGSGPSRVTVELRPHEEGTELTLIHEHLPTDQIDPHRGGWDSILGHLAALLAGDANNIN